MAMSRLEHARRLDLAPVGTIDEAIARLADIDAALPLTDGVAWFVKLYLAVTRAVAGVVRGGKLEDPDFLAALAVFYTNRFFAAFDASGRRRGQVPRAWAPLFDARADARVAPIQFALAGMSAHVNYDLPIGLVEVGRERGVAPAADSPQHRDFNRVNPQIKRTETKVKKWFATGFIGVIDQATRPVDDVIAVWSLIRARETGWAHGEVLWHLRDHQELVAADLLALGRVVGLAGRALLVPTRLD